MKNIKRYTHYLLILLILALNSCIQNFKTEGSDISLEKAYYNIIDQTVKPNDSVVNLAREEIRNNQDQTKTIYFACMILGKNHEWVMNTDSALYYYDMATQLSEKLKNNLYQGISLQNVAQILRTSGLQEDAKSIITRSNYYFELEKDTTNLIRNYILTGNIFRDFSVNDSAFIYFFMAEKLAEHSRDIKLKSKIYMSISAAFIIMKNKNKSLEYTNKALDICKVNKLEKEYFDNLMNLGINYKNTGEYRLAEECYLRVDSFYRLNQTQEKRVRLAYNWVILLNIQGKYDEALEKMLYVNKLSKEINYFNVYAASEQVLGEIYDNLNNFNEAKKHYQLAIELGKEKRDIDFLQRCYSDIVVNSIERKNYKDVKTFFGLYHDYTDSLRTITPTKEISRMEVASRMQTIKNNLTEAKLKVSEEHNRSILMFWIFVTISLLLSFYFYFKTKSAKLRAQALEEKNRSTELKLEKQRALNKLKDAEANSIKLQNKLKDQQLMSISLLELEKRNLIHRITSEIDKQFSSKYEYDSRQTLEKVHITLSNIIENEDLVFLNKFKDLNPAFSEKLLELHPDLSNKEIKICAMTFLNMSNKEIASVMNIQIKSLKMSKYRLRKKLNLEDVEFITQYLRSLV